MLRITQFILLWYTRLTGSILYSFFLLIWASVHLSAQSSSPPDRVLHMRLERYGNRELAQDKGIAGAWQKLLKLQTTASVLHTTAHPDDEHADLLTFLSRGRGVRTSLLSLNRGEAGANVLGGELFDALGLLRTEEMLMAGMYYGLDDLYFTDVVDYGYSKRVEETYEKWNKQHVLEQMVRVIRINRPLVIVSRFHGTVRDGHGNHQAAGEISQLAFDMAGDPKAFLDQLAKEGLRPWKPLKLYRGGVNETEPWNLTLNFNEYSPWLGESYASFASAGYSMHRSQFGGIRPQVSSEAKRYYERLPVGDATGKKEQSLFDGIDTSVKGIYQLTGETPAAGGPTLLAAIESAISQATALFTPDSLGLCVPYLTQALSKTRKLIRLSEKNPETLFLLQIKEQQLEEAILTIIGVELQAVAIPKDAQTDRHFYQPPPTLSSVMPGQVFKVETKMSMSAQLPVEVSAIQLLAPAGWQIQPANQNEKVSLNYQKPLPLFTVTVAPDAVYSQPVYFRKTIQENHYQPDNISVAHLPNPVPVLIAKATILINQEPIEIYKPVICQEASLPYGYNPHLLKVTPAISVVLQPKTAVVALVSKEKSVKLEANLESNSTEPVEGTLSLILPEGWRTDLKQIPFSFTKAGEKSSFTFTVTATTSEKKDFKIKAVAIVNNQQFTSGYTLIKHRDLDKQYVYNEASTLVKAMDVKIRLGIKIGYVMGAGDEVPQALRQLETRVQLLTEADLANGHLENFQVIMLGTRAYAVRPDLYTYHQRLMEYVKNGGHLLVLYQTPEFDPQQMAPIWAKLPQNAEEVSQEDAPIQLLATNHLVINTPNKITQADFDGWVEQRGSKFFSEWDKAYVPIMSTHDTGQDPQKGGWLMASYGKGNYTYFAYALHRQLPYGVEGAYRILANLVSYGVK